VNSIFEKGLIRQIELQRCLKIAKVQKTNPVTYLLEDYKRKPVAKTFYEFELHRAADPDVYFVKKVLCKKEDKIYVKWLRFDNLHNSWIHKNNVLLNNTFLLK